MTAIAFSGANEKVRPVRRLSAVVVVRPGIMPKRIPA
jgi:hypothetical protein